MERRPGSANYLKHFVIIKHNEVADFHLRSQSTENKGQFPTPGEYNWLSLHLMRENQVAYQMLEIIDRQRVKIILNEEK